MAWVDVLMIALIAVSTLVSLLRGFVREILSLAAWVLAFWLALSFSGALAPHLGFVSDTETVRTVTAFVIVFVGVLIAGALVNHAIAAAVKGVGLGGVDRLVGMAFGFARGVAVVAALMVIGIAAGAPTERWWQESRMIDVMMPVAVWMHGFLPTDIA